MTHNALYLTAQREGYSLDQIKHTMTVGELIDFLSGYDEDLPVYLAHDNHYTYGGIRAHLFEEGEWDDNGDSCDEDEGCDDGYDDEG